MTTSWYCQIERTTYGPLTAQDLKRMAEKGKLRPTDLIKKTEAGKWVTASSVKGLLFKPAAQAVLNLSVKQIATTTDRTCPNCRSTVEVGSVLCMGCGYNFLAGKSHAKAVSPKKHGRRGLGLAGIASGLLMAICLTIYLIDFRGRQAPRDTPQVIAQSPGLGSQKEPDGKSAKGEARIAPSPGLGSQKEPNGTSAKGEAQIAQSPGLGSQKESDGKPAKREAQNNAPSLPTLLSPPAAKPSVAWAKQLASTIDGRDVLDIVGARLKDARFGDVGKAWMVALKGRISEEEYKDLPLNVFVSFVPRYHPIWKNDVLQPAPLEERLARIKFLTREIIIEWQRELQGIQGDGVSELWTVGFLVDIDRLFDARGIKANEADLLRGRFKVLPQDAVASLATLLKTGQARAAILMIQNDWMFEHSRVNEQIFNDALNVLKQSAQDGK